MITTGEVSDKQESRRWMFWLALSIALLLGMATAAIAETLPEGLSKSTDATAF
jgi:hypothetical protein